MDPFDSLLNQAATVMARTASTAGGYGGAPSFTAVGLPWPCRVAIFSVPVDKEVLSKAKEVIAYKKVYGRPWFADPSPDGSYVPNCMVADSQYNTEPLTHDHWLQIRGRMFDICEDPRNPGDMDHHLEVICRMVLP